MFFATYVSFKGIRKYWRAWRVKRRESKVKVTNCNCMALRRAARRISNAYDAKLAPAGLTTAQFNILAVLDNNDHCSVNALADATELDRTTMGKNIRLLERNGVVRVGESKEDRRSRAISITAKGTQMLLAATPLWEQAQLEFERANGRAVAASLRRALDKLGRSEEAPRP